MSERAARVSTASSASRRGEGAHRLEQPDDPAGALDVAALALGQDGCELGLGRRAGDERVDDVAAVLEDRPG